MTIVLPAEVPPCGALDSPRGRLPLVVMDVRSDVAGLLATTRIRQSFVNAFDEPIEATYVFPLPDRAGVTSFVATLAGRRVEGVLKERQAARDAYDAAIAAGQRAAILEEDRPGVFSARVGNLQSGETAEIHLELTGPLAYDGGEATYRFPLVVAPRYIAGTPIDGVGVGEGIALDTDLVPDASRITPPVLLPGHPNPVNLSLEVGIDPLGLPLSNVRSTLHAALISNDPVTVALRPGERLDRDVIVRFSLAGAATATTAALTPDEPSSAEGTWSVTVVPPAAATGASTTTQRPLDVAVVLDRSGSMAGWKMVAARRAAARIVDALTSDDRLVVLGFDDRIEHPDRLGDALVPATDQHRFAAVEFLAGLEARGGTDLHLAAEKAAKTLAASANGVLVLITDGQIGQEDHTLRVVAPHLDTTRVFTVGIDKTVNAGFLRRLADAGRGRCELVESEDALDEAMARIHRAVSTPVVEDLTVSAEGIELVPGTATPSRGPDLYPGAPVVLGGRYRGRTANARFTVTGRQAGGSPWSQTAHATTVRNRAVRTTWARAHVRDLEDRYAVEAGDALAARIVDASLTHGVLSRFTAFVAVDPSEPPGSTAPRPVIQPVELPAAWPVAAAPMASGGRLRLASAPMPMPMMASEAYAPLPSDPLDRIRQVLDELDQAGFDPIALADELEEIERDLPPGRDQLRKAVLQLAAALRAGEEVKDRAAAVRKAMKRKPFWR